MWKGGAIHRRTAYDWLSRRMGLPMDQTHIGMFDVEQCKRVVEICAAQNNQPDQPEKSA